MEEQSLANLRSSTIAELGLLPLVASAVEPVNDGFNVA